MVDPVIIVVGIIALLIVVVLLKKIFKVIGILVIIALILLVMFPKECGYNIGEEVKECKCLGYMKEGDVSLCYGSCRECGSEEAVNSTGNGTLVATGLSILDKAKGIKKEIEKFDI